MTMVVGACVNIMMDSDTENEMGASGQAVTLQGLTLVSYFHLLGLTSSAI